MNRYAKQVSLVRRPKILGYRKNGAPIWQVMGASDDDDPIERIERRNAEIALELEELDKQIGTQRRSEAQKADWDKLEAELAKNEKDLEELRSVVKEREERAARVKAARSKWNGTQVKANVDKDDLYEVDFRQVGSRLPGVHRNLIERSTRIMDDPEIGGHLEDHQRSRVTKLLRTSNGDTSGELIAALLIATSNPHYRSAFQKATSTITPVFTPEEGRAVNEVTWIKRAMSIGTSASGGFAVPVVIDPTVILTAQGTSNDLIRLARLETITNDRWRGLSSAGVSWKFDAEAAPSADNSPSLAKPEVPTFRADGFIPYSIEVGQDWPGFAEEMARMLGSGYDELLADKLTTGSAANTPTGLVSRLAQQTAPVVIAPSTTAGVLAGADVYKMWARLPQRHRRKSTTAWMSSTDIQNALRQLGTVDPNFTVDITNEAIPRLFAREYPMNDYMASMPAVATNAANTLIVGDFRGFLVAQRAGMSIEFVPMLFDVTNNRPTGQRGWYAYARVGSDVIDPTAFQMLQNKTS